jgi:hypothetical protein
MAFGRKKKDVAEQQQTQGSTELDDLATVKDTAGGAAPPAQQPPPVKRAAAPPSRTVLVTGGSTWAGLALGRALLSKGWTVLLFDQRPPLCALPPGLEWCQGREAADPHLLAEALAVNGPVGAVVHLGMAAAGGGDGTEAQERVLKVRGGRTGETARGG